MYSAHSKLPPSSAARRMACPGSRALSERYGSNTESESSQEGTRAHQLAALWLRGQNSTESYTDEMWDGAKYYESSIKRFVNLDILHIEEKVDCSNIHPDMWGTPDAWAVFDNALHVFDYKFGITPVEAFENWQLIAYAAGILKDISEITTVFMHIIQPRDYISSNKHKVWSLTDAEFRDYALKLLWSETLSTGPNAQLKVSVECKYCPARHACPALKQAAFGATEIAYRDSPQGIDPKHVGSELKLLHEAQDILGYRITALETEVQHLLQAGVNVDHYELKPGEGRMTWNTSTSKIIETALLMGVDLRKEYMLTPSQALKAGLDKETVLKYSERKQSLKLSKIDVSKSKAVFKKR